MPVSPHLTQDAVFIGANRQGLVADQIPGLVAFGANNNVALWNPLAPNKKGVYYTLKKHTKEVTCVRFLPATKLLISAGEDGEINLWRQEIDNQNVIFLLAQTLQEPSSVTCMSVTDDQIFVTGNSSGDLKIWGPGDDAQFVCLHTFKVKVNFYPTTLALQKIGKDYLLVVGGTSSDLFVYSFGIGASAFVQCAVLTGHEDWIKCLAFVAEKEGSNYVLASGSQDRYIRLWRLRLNEAIDDSDEDDLKLVLLSNKQYKFAFAHGRAAFSFEALIMGHDDWVTGLQWHPSNSRHGKSTSRKLQLLSLSADTALMIWEMDQDSGIWCSVTRLGEMSIKGASTATGASGGFWSCLWFEDYESGDHVILANGKTGAIRVYKTSDHTTWDSELGVTGATREITDLVWSTDGTYCIATSLDQTSRLFAPWVSNRPKGDEHSVTWHEFARPQIHGYDMICLANISGSRFVSGGDEKILRVFEMTQSIGDLLHKFCGVEVASDVLPEAASLPVLGLSNKAANEQLEAGEAQQREEDYEENKGDNKEKTDILASLQGPPLEDYLQRHTLFPEIEKLYGHGYELTCCCVSPNGNLLASACRSNSAKHAVVRIFNIKKDFQLVDEVLTGHNLTITSLEFSPDGQNLVAVSRDRQLSLWRVRDEEEGTFNLVELNLRAHSRIIWDCSWAPSSQYGLFFVTGSRDKTLKLWEVSESGATLVASLKTDDAITSVACHQKQLLKNLLIVAVGYESGQIDIVSVDMAGERKLQIVLVVDGTISPGAKVSKLSFSTKWRDDKLLLAVGSNDSSVRMYSLSTQLFL